MDINTPIVSKPRVSPKDVFLHLLAIVTLYFSAGSFITLLFQYVNALVRDPLFSGDDYYLRPYLGPLRFAVSSLVVVFPVFIIISFYLNKSYNADVVKRDLRIRKWLIYFTLFAAALFMIGDLVSLIYNFLGGEITTRFILKALSILIVAGAVFWYYLLDVRHDAPATFRKIFARAVSVVVGAVVIGGFFLAGSPAAERLRRFDDERLGNLQEIQWRVVNYWQQKNKLPETLNMLRDDISGFIVPVDPETKASYEYAAKEGTTFELCATFNKPSAPQTGEKMMRRPMAVKPGFDLYSTTWDHGTGRTCFERTIDKDLYPPVKPIVR